MIRKDYAEAILGALFNKSIYKDENGKSRLTPDQEFHRLKNKYVDILSGNVLQVDSKAYLSAFKKAHDVGEDGTNKLDPSQWNRYQQIQTEVKNQTDMFWWQLSTRRVEDHYDTYDTYYEINQAGEIEKKNVRDKIGCAGFSITRKAVTTIASLWKTYPHDRYLGLLKTLPNGLGENWEEVTYSGYSRANLNRFYFTDVSVMTSTATSVMSEPEIETDSNLVKITNGKQIYFSEVVEGNEEKIIGFGIFEEASGTGSPIIWGRFKDEETGENITEGYPIQANTVPVFKIDNFTFYFN